MVGQCWQFRLKRVLTCHPQHTCSGTLVIGVLVPGNLIGIDLPLCYKNLMKLTREEVQRVAMLARLRLTPEDEERLTEQLDNILQYVEKLNQLDTSGIEPFTHAAHICKCYARGRHHQRA